MTKRNFYPILLKLPAIQGGTKQFFKKSSLVENTNLPTNTSFTSADTLCLIPLVTENNTAITGILVAAIQNGQVECHFALLNRYHDMGALKREFVISLIQLEKHVYGRTSFKIHDNLLLGNAHSMSLRNRQQPNGGRTETLDDPCTIVEIWYDPTAEECHCSGDEYYTGEWYYEGDCSSGAGALGIFEIFNNSSGGGGTQTLPGGGGNNGGGGTPEMPPPYSSTFTERLNYLQSQLSLTTEASDFLSTNEEAVNEMYLYVNSNPTAERKAIAAGHIQRLATDQDYVTFVNSYQSSSGTSNDPWWENDTFLTQQGGSSFGLWAINYLSQNPSLDFSTFQNWFFDIPEYIGGEDVIDPTMITYDDPITQSPLPPLNTFVSHFPKLGSTGNYSQMPSPQVYQLVGGSPYSNHLTGNPNYQNACALRGSRALLYSGINIPVLRIGSSQRTEKGSDNKNYILDAVSFNKFMISKFGDTPIKLEGADANDPQKIATLLNGKNGIYVIINNSSSAPPNGPGYSGHVDLILNGKCIGASYTTPVGGVKSIRIWVLN